MEDVANNRAFTGWHMLAIMVAFFGTIISVNVTMAWYANSSWSGMLSNNTYVASQDFNIKAAEAREWAREGLGGKLAVDRSTVAYLLQGPRSLLNDVTSVTAIFRRPVGDGQDFKLPLEVSADGAYSAKHGLAPGPWIVDVETKSGERTVFHQAQRVVVGEGSR